MALIPQPEKTKTSKTGKTASSRSKKQDDRSALEKAQEALGLAEEDLHTLLLYAPRNYVDYSKVLESFDDMPSIKRGERICLMAGVRSIKLFDKNKRPTNFFGREDRRPFRAEVEVNDQGRPGRRSRSTMVVNFFGNVWGLKNVKPGDTLFLTGKCASYFGKPQIEAPEIIPMRLSGTIDPVYPALRGQVSAEDMHEAVETVFKRPGALMRAVETLCERLDMSPERIQSVCKISPMQLLRYMHEPRSEKQGRYCIAAARMITSAMILDNAKKYASLRRVNKSAIKIQATTLGKVLARVQHKFPLTEDQSRSINEILDDLQSAYPMRRLLSGDVGTGKTITFLAPALAVQMSGRQAAILAPNELVVNQIADEVRHLFPDLPVQAVSGKTRKLEENALWVGTTAVLSRIEKQKLDVDFLAVDEQHKFSREQRELLVKRGTNYLEATATAIPRTMALVSHAGMKVSQLSVRPFKREVDTRVYIGDTYKRAMFEKTRDTLRAGGQMAIVYPAVQKSESMIDVEEAAAQWERIAPGLVSKLHGKMKAEEKEEAIRAFKAREKMLLITSTVIEVGVSLPDLRGIIVINAERYGLAQLHQLRGRVARLGGEGTCILYCPNSDVGEETIARLQLMERIDNGFELAEADLEQRGFGDLDVHSSLQAGRSVAVFNNITVAPHHLKAMEKRLQAQEEADSAPEDESQRKSKCPTV